MTNEELKTRMLNKYAFATDHDATMRMEIQDVIWPIVEAEVLERQLTMQRLMKDTVDAIRDEIYVPSGAGDRRDEPATNEELVAAIKALPARYTGIKWWDTAELNEFNRLKAENERLKTELAESPRRPQTELTGFRLGWLGWHRED